MTIIDLFNETINNFDIIDSNIDKYIINEIINITKDKIIEYIYQLINKLLLDITPIDNKYNIADNYIIYDILDLKTSGCLFTKYDINDIYIENFDYIYNDLIKIINYKFNSY